MYETSKGIHTLISHGSVVAFNFKREHQLQFTFDAQQSILGISKSTKEISTEQ